MKQKEFLEIESEITAEPLRTEAGEMLGWAISRSDATLKRDRGGIRTFKALCSVSKFCEDNKIDDFNVKGLLRKTQK